MIHIEILDSEELSPVRREELEHVRADSLRDTLSSVATNSEVATLLPDTLPPCDFVAIATSVQDSPSQVEPLIVGWALARRDIVYDEAMGNKDAQRELGNGLVVPELVVAKGGENQYVECFMGAALLRHLASESDMPVEVTVRPDYPTTWLFGRMAGLGFYPAWRHETIATANEESRAVQYVRMVHPSAHELKKSLGQRTAH